MNYTECIENARPRLGKYCKACPECNGRACKNQMPGPGSKGIGDTAIRNYDKWKQIRVNMDTIAENKPVDTSLTLFGRTFKYPVFAGPVGAVQLHYGDCLDDVTYNDILVSACAGNGIAAFTGDGTDPNVMVAATKAIKNADGAGIPTVKPWNIETIREKMELVHESGAFAVAMDIDAAGLPFLKNLDPPAGSKTVSELCDIIQMAGTPFIVKGIMTVKGALKAKEACRCQRLCNHNSGRNNGYISSLADYVCLSYLKIRTILVDFLHHLAGSPQIIHSLFFRQLFHQIRQHGIIGRLQNRNLRKRTQYGHILKGHVSSSVIRSHYSRI